MSAGQVDRVSDLGTVTAGVVTTASVSDLPLAEVQNPAAVDELVGYYALADHATVDAVVTAAEIAGRDWARLPGTDRAKWLRAAAAAVEADQSNVDARATLLTREQGKVLWESHIDVHSPGRALRENAALAEIVDIDDVVRDDRGTTIIRRVPVGPTAVIVPWNYPIYLTLAGVAPALAAGNAVIVKPSEFAPLTITRTLEIVAAALPPGVLSVVPGEGSVAGTALVEHPDIRKVIFTGGTSTGKLIAKSAADTLKNVSMELGGNDPAIVLSSADLNDNTIRELSRAVFTCSGQVCMNIKRIYVHRSLYSEFVDKFTSAADQISVGDGQSPESTIGPLNNAKQFKAVSGLIAETRTHARVTTVGRKVHPDSWHNGHFILPSVVTDIAPEAPLVVREQFGPVIPIMSFDDEDMAVRQANDSEFGLAASVWSEDIDHALHVARQVESGSVFVNSHRLGSSDQTVPFGGMKQSGIGRNHGMWAIDECSELQAITHRPNTKGFPGPEYHHPR